MSDFDRNIATARAGYRPEVAIDAGLRAYMIRVYNYMTAGVALTGLVAWFAFQAAGGDQIHIVGNQVTGLTAFGEHGADAVLRLCRPARAVAGDDLPCLYGSVDHAGLFHLGGDVRRDEP